MKIEWMYSSSGVKKIRLNPCSNGMKIECNMSEKEMAEAMS